MITPRKVTEDTLKLWGFDPDKPVSCMTTSQLYELIEFAINRNK